VELAGLLGGFRGHDVGMFLIRIHCSCKSFLQEQYVLRRNITLKPPTPVFGSFSPVGLMHSYKPANCVTSESIAKRSKALGRYEWGLVV
jgi:hypothetical protein